MGKIANFFLDLILEFVFNKFCLQKKKKKNIRIYKCVICNLNSINEKYDN